MQLLHEHQILLATVRNINMSGNTVLTKEPTMEHHEVKENISSNGSLLMMNPVASGDNMATGLNSAHKLKEELPPLVPCCEGKELQISEDLVRTGLSAISVRHDTSVIQSLSMSRACERVQVPTGPGLIRVSHRNSFRSLHRPDLKRVPYLRRMTPDELETLFRGNSDFPSKTNCGSRFEGSRMSLPPESLLKDVKKEAQRQDDGNTVLQALHPIPETRSGAEDVPEGMRLHGVRARLYTSVLAGAKAGDQLDGIAALDEYDSHMVGEPLPEEEVLNEELQIILPPRSDDVIAESSNTNSVSNDSATTTS